MKKLIAGIAALGVLTGCSMTKDVSTAEAGVATFHQELNAGQLEAIYTSAGPHLKQATTQAALVQLLSAVRRKLGPFESGRSAGWNDNATTSGHFVRLTYSSKYARGAAQETFVFQLDGPTPLLTGYNINSTALIVN